VLNYTGDNDQFTSTSGTSIYLFTDHDGNGRTVYDKLYTFKGKIYYYKHKKAGVLTNNLIPCYSKGDSQPGFYDTVSGVFHGDESDPYLLTYGADVNH
jgi:hypothetical protein